MRILYKISDYSLLLIWILQSCFILLLTSLNPNHYTTIDSHYYLESAQNILSGNGYSTFQNKQYIWNSTFPPGYALAIALISFLTKTNVFVASKLVNLIASAVWLISLKRWFGNNRAVAIALILLTGSFLKLWVHSWSEPLFLVILFSWTYHFYRMSTRENLPVVNMVSFFMLGILLILTRYAGIFIIPLTFLYGLIGVVKREKSKTLLYIILASGWALTFGGYLWINFILSGEWFGGGRFEAKMRPVENVNIFIKGLLNELLIIRNTDFLTVNTLFCVSLTMQVLLLVLISQQITANVNLKKVISIRSYFLTTAVFYLFFLFLVRLFSPFDQPGYRLLAPFSFLILISVLLSWRTKKKKNLLKYLLIFLIVLSWMDLIPQQGFKIKALKAVLYIGISDYQSF
jgi:hypothetical protein